MVAMVTAIVYTGNIGAGGGTGFDDSSLYFANGPITKIYLWMGTTFSGCVSVTLVVT
jgi:hypothetical protein